MAIKLIYLILSLLILSFLALDVTPRIQMIQPFVWLLQNLTLSSAVFVTIIFWGFLFRGEYTVRREITHGRVEVGELYMQITRHAHVK